MKIALCFSGNIHSLQECYPNIKKYLMDNNDVDVYAHLWWHTSYKGQKFSFNSTDCFVNRDMDKEFIELYKPKNYIIELQRKFLTRYTGENSDDKLNVLTSQINYFNLLSQYYSKMKSNELSENSGIKYDVVVHLRTDCLVKPNRYLIDTLKMCDYNNCLCLSSNAYESEEYCLTQDAVPTDWFSIGNPEMMSIFTKQLYELLRGYRTSDLINNNLHLNNVLKNLHAKVFSFDSGTSVYSYSNIADSIERINYSDIFDFEKWEWIDVNNNLPHYAKYINFNGFNCIICGNNEFDIHNNVIRNYAVDIYRIIKCHGCSHIQLFPNNYDVKHYYDDDSQDYEALRIINRDAGEWRNMVKSQASRRLEILENIINLNNVTSIDIGGGYGDFVELMSNKYPDSSVTVMEPGVTRITSSSLSNLTKINQLMDSRFADENEDKYDIVTSFHVLEHVLEPKLFIKNCYKILKPGGLLYIEVPNQQNDLINLSEYYRDNIWYMKAHLSYFTSEVIELILNDLEIKKYHIHGFERYDHSNYLNWIATNRPQLNCTYYDGVPKTNEEKEWIENRELAKKTDCFYIIIEK